MTLFVKTPRRLLEISDIYVMAFSFLIFFVVGRVVKAVLYKQKVNNTKINNTKINVRGGNFGFEISDDEELAYTILTCIADNERYLVKDPELIKAVFTAVKAKIKKESLVLTPNMLRFFALKLINNNQTLVVKIGNVLIASNNQVRLATRVAGSAIIGFFTALALSIPYGLFIMLLYFDATANCGYKCSDYFEQLPHGEHIEISAESPNGNLFIGTDDDAKQLEIYIPSTAANEVTVKNEGKLKKIKTYTKVEKKARYVKFTDFKENDPVLSRFKDLDEPDVPQKICPINDIHNIIDVEIVRD